MSARQPTHPCTSRAFTLTEAAVVVAIAAVLLALAIPPFQAIRDAARQTTCLSNARQVSLAINAFAASNGNRLPENRTLISGGEYVTWRHRLMDTGASVDESAWACPSHPDPGPRGELGYTENGTLCVGDVRSSYAINGHVLWRGEKTDRLATQPDTAIRRPDHTILVAETNRVNADLRVSPPIVANYYQDWPGPFAYWHSRKGVYAFQDGHAEVLGFLETGSPDCRWHNGRDLTDDPYVPQTQAELRPHDHPDWEFLVPDIYR